MDQLCGKQLVKKNRETVSADEALKDKDVVAFYFSAHWCPPCRIFTPVLADFYEELIEKNKSFEVVFVSSDQSEAAFYDYLEESHGNWLALPYGSPLITELKNIYKISGIPTLVVVKKDGTIVSPNARKDVESKGIAVFEEWKSYTE